VSRYQNAGRSHHVKIDKSSFKRVEDYKYLETPLTYKNSIYKEMKFEVRECLLSFGAASFVFEYVVQKYED
jgi:hypothetical protein